MDEIHNDGTDTASDRGEHGYFSFGNNIASKYKHEYAEKLVQYFMPENESVIYDEEFYSDGTVKKRTPRMVLPPRFPTFELFAAEIGVTFPTLLNWREQHSEFREAYDLAKQMQLGIAKRCGVTKLYDASFTKFLLVNDHGLSDRSAVETSQDKPFEVNITIRQS